MLGSQCRLQSELLSAVKDRINSSINLHAQVCFAAVTCGDAGQEVRRSCLI